MTYFIINPAAGNGKTLAAVPTIKKVMEREGRPYKLLETKKPRDGTEMARRAVDEGADCVVAVGGDGTVQEVAEGLVNSGVPLGILPSGNGNDFAETIKILSGEKPPKSFSDMIESYLHRMLNSEPGYIDAVKMNGKLHFLNIGSVGLDAEIVVEAANFKKTFGKLSYIVSTVKNAVTYKPSRIGIVCDGAETDAVHTLAALCNGKYYGGGFKIAPMADIRDGFITACIIKNMSKFKVLTLFPLVLFGRHTNLKEVKFINCKKASIFFDGIRNVNLDGNIYELSGPLHFEIVEKALKIYY